MESKVFDKVLEELLNVVPAGWKKIAFYAEYESGSYSMKYYVDMGDGKYKDCFDIAPEKDIIKTFLKIDRIFSEERKKIAEKELWTVVSIFFSAEGKVKALYDYQNVQDNSIEYFEKWKKKHLM